MKWFKKRIEEPFVPPREPVEYPTGTCLKVGDDFYYVRGKRLLRIPSLRILSSWAFPFIIPASVTSLNRAGYKVSGKLGFRDGSIVCDYVGQKVYVISESRKRLVTSPDVLARWNIKDTEIPFVSTEELALHADGEVLS